MINLTSILAYFGVGLKGGRTQNIQGKLAVCTKKFPKQTLGILVDVPSHFLGL
ncbi:hypothetical protein G5C01_06605 [Moraxella bovoculi]|uniref:hypothetical protein n=1 Tax=Moraxella bovoculi TaxID=386891 RepID=UPI0012D382AC|nr:hypothetical protein [Moraxella bovoculi]NSM11023.1 hypothetical protein [Moraxella bovoculi]